jgi:hypothetical protein
MHAAFAPAAMIAGALGLCAFGRFLWMNVAAERTMPARIHSAEGHARPTAVAPLAMFESEYKALIDR